MTDPAPLYRSHEQRNPPPPPPPLPIELRLDGFQSWEIATKLGLPIEEVDESIHAVVEDYLADIGMPNMKPFAAIQLMRIERALRVISESRGDSADRAEKAIKVSAQITKLLVSHLKAETPPRPPGRHPKPQAPVEKPPLDIGATDADLLKELDSAALPAAEVQEDLGTRTAEEIFREEL